MTTNEKQNEQPKSVERKELTPQQLQTRKKMVIFPLFFLAFVGCMWLIFVPDTKDEQPTSGFNTDLPTPEQNGIVSDKRDAYIQEEMKRKQQDKMRSLQDFAFELDGGEAAQESEPQVTVYADNRPRYGGRTSGNAFRSRTRNSRKKCRLESRSWSVVWKRSRSVRVHRKSRWRCSKNHTRSPPAT